MNRLALHLGAAVLLLGLTALALQPAQASAAPDRALRRCEAAIHDRAVRYAVYTAPHWTVRCVRKIRQPGFSGAVGLTITVRREILIVTSTGDPRSILAHELAHAFSWDRMSVEERASFARRVGEPAFYGGSIWATMPAEIWANNQARCAGYRNLAPTSRVPCKLIRRFVRQARG